MISLDLSLMCGPEGANFYFILLCILYTFYNVNDSNYVLVYIYTGQRATAQQFNVQTRECSSLIIRKFGQWFCISFIQYSNPTVRRQMNTSDSSIDESNILL